MSVPLQPGASAHFSLKSNFTGGAWVSRMLVVCLFVFALGLSALCLVHATQLIGKPFAGFLLYDFPGVGSFGDYEWAGIQAGVRYRDVILGVNGERVYTGADVHRIVESTPQGTSLEYTLGRQGETLAISVPVTQFTLKDFLKTFLFPFIGGFTFFAIGFVVFILKPDTTTSWTFLCFCLSLGTYFVTGFEVQSGAWPIWSYYVNLTGFSLFPAACIHLSLIFPDKTTIIKNRPWCPLLLYGCSLMLFTLPAYYFNALINAQAGVSETVALSSQMLIATYISRAYAVIAAVSIFAFSIASYWRSSSIIAKQRARVVLFGSGVAFIPATIAMFLVSINKVVIPFNFFTLPGLIFPAAIGYAIARHNLFDVDVYIKRTVGYVLMSSIVAGAYFVFERVVKATVLDPLLGDSSEKVYPFLFALLTVFAFNPVSRKVQQGVDTMFFRKGVDFKTAVAGVSESLTSMVDVQAFIEKIIDTVRTDLFVDRAGVVVLDARTNTCRSTFHGGKFGRDTAPLEEMTDPGLSPDDPLLALLAREKKLITRYDVAEDPRYSAVRESCGQRFEELGASLALPLYYHDQFSGAFTLGYKKSGHFYTREDIDLLKTLSTMTSTAIEQSREKGQKAVLMQLFSKHVSPQVAESLWEQREQFLEGGRPKSQSMVVTAMFTDLQGFSTISEKQTPEILMNWLNTYLDMMTTTVMEHGGVVDDFFGDGVKINFGVPIPRETEDAIRQDAVNAINCALAMEQRMIVLNEKMAEQGQQPLRMRIGIYTGPVVAGSLGSAERLKYTTIGDTVNTAARLESFDKDLVIPGVTASPCRILIGEPTLRHVENKFDVEKVGELNLKGKAERIGAYCVLGTHTVGSAPMRQGSRHSELAG